jgi:hypothetical protein
MRTAWTALQQEASVGATCPLGHLLSEAVVLLHGPEVEGLREDGTSPKQLQRLLTREVEQEHYRAPGKEIMLLPGMNWERMAWRAYESATATACGVGDFLAEAHYYDVARRARDTCRHVLRQAHPSASQSRG